MPILKEDPSCLIIRCKCTGHALEVYNDTEWIKDGVDPDFDVSLWDRYPRSVGLLERFRLMWRLLIYGDLTAGDVIIEESDAQALSNFILRKLAENQIAKQEYEKTKKS